MSEFSDLLYRKNLKFFGLFLWQSNTDQIQTKKFKKKLTLKQEQQQSKPDLNLSKFNINTSDFTIILSVSFE